MTALDPDTIGPLARDLPPADFVRIVHTFEIDLARLVAQMVDYATAGDLEEYRRSAHALAGAAGAIGAMRLAADARLAMDPREQTPPRDILGRIGGEARQVLAELAGWAAGVPPAA
ncbi:Hpt domain-containing protein [Humitalea sp. 24SJ18S-53]|uniref:Hpt domain-containing protein n=1 Tax=Humitalea sp. 24SJ18S-53 TaxID=3422307 RepID=UPI003D66825B